MKFIINLLLTASLFLTALTACSPRINENVYKKYNATTPGDVRIFNINDTIPLSAEIIGTLSASDNVFSYLKLRDAQTIMRETTAKNGGNGFAIYDIAPTKNEKSSCPFLSGMMLNMNDTIINNDSVHQLTQEIILYQEKKKAKRLPHNNFTLDAGYGGVTSEYQIPIELTSGSLTSGVVLSAGYKYISNSGWFFGINIARYSSSASNYNNKLKMRQLFITPDFGFKGKLGKRVIMGASMGIGYYDYNEYIKTDNEEFILHKPGVALTYDFDTEYIINKNISIGAKIGAFMGSVNRKENKDPDNKKNEGVKNLVFSIGPRFYF